MENRSKKRGFRGSMLCMLIIFVFAFIKFAAGGAITFTCSHSHMVTVLLAGGLLQCIVAFVLPIGFCFCWEKHRILVHIFVVVIILLTTVYITTGCIISSHSSDLLRRQNKTITASLTFDHKIEMKNETVSNKSDSHEEDDESSLLHDEESRHNSSIDNEDKIRQCRMVLLKIVNVIFPLDVILAAAASTAYVYVSVKRRKLPPKVYDENDIFITHSTESEDLRPQNT